MKKYRNLIFIILILAVVILFFVIKNGNSTLKKELSDFAIKDTATITRIFIADKEGRSTLLEKQSPANWLVNGKYKAEIQNIQILLKTFFKMEVRSPVALAARNNIIENIASLGRKVEVYQTAYRINLFGKIKWFPYDKKVKTIYVGEATMDNQGTFMLIENSTAPFVVYIPGFRGYLSSRFSTNPEDYRNRRIITLRPNQIQQIKINFPGHENESYEVNKIANRQFSIKPQNPAIPFILKDSVLLYDFLNYYSNVSFSSFQNNFEKKDSILASKPVATIFLADTAKQEYFIKLFLKKAPPPKPGLDQIDVTQLEWDPNGMWAAINNDSDFVYVQSYYFDNLIRPLSYFAQETNQVNTKRE